MRRHVPGLGNAANNNHPVPEGRLLVTVQRILFVNGQKPYFALCFRINQPEAYAGQQVQTRLYCTERALWKLNWFLRDFAYDSELLEQEQIDAKAVIGLCGVIRVSRVSVNGRAFSNVDTFAPAATWEEPGFAPEGAESHNHEEDQPERQA